MIVARSCSQNAVVRFVGDSHFGEDEIHTGGVEWEDVKVGTGASLIEQLEFDINFEDITYQLIIVNFLSVDC